MNHRNHHIIILFCLCVFLLGLFSPLKLQATVKLGSEFQVNTYFYESQEYSSVAGLSNGGFVVTWQSLRQYGDSYSVYGQRYDSSGNTAGSEFRVPTYTTSGQGSPSAAGLSNGGFVVTWTGLGLADLTGIYGQRYDSSGNTVGSEFRINTYTTDGQTDPSAAGFSDGGFVVVWTSFDQDGSYFGVYGQLYDSSGNTVGTEFQVNTYTEWSQQRPSVARLADDGFVVTWDSGPYQDVSGLGVYGQRYNSSGSTVGTEFQVNTYTTNSQSRSSVVGLSGGGFVVTWDSEYQDGSSNGIYGQLFDGSGNKVGTEFQINTITIHGQFRPSVVSFRGDYFVVTWGSYEEYGSEYNVHAQKFNSSGDKVGDEFRVNTHTASGQNYPSIAALGGDRFVVTWQSWDQDGQFNGVYGQRFFTELFGDELAIDFVGTNGVWNVDTAATWRSISGGNVETMAGWANGLAMDFLGTSGVWNVDGTAWSQISGSDVETMVGWANGLAMDFGASGVWNVDPAGTWTPISGNAETMAAWDKGLALDFGASGVWNVDTAGMWTPISGDAETMAAWANGLALDFGASGVWNVDTAGTWTPISGNAEAMVGWANGLALDFGASGVWNVDTAGTWTPISGDAEIMVGWAKGLAMDFGPGLWNVDTGWTWSPISSGACNALTDVDLY